MEQVRLVELDEAWRVDGEANFGILIKRLDEVSERVTFFGFNDDLPRIATGGVFMKGGRRSGKINVGEFFERTMEFHDLFNSKIFGFLNNRDTEQVEKGW